MVRGTGALKPCPGEEEGLKTAAGGTVSVTEGRHLDVRRSLGRGATGQGVDGRGHWPLMWQGLG